MSLKRYWYSKPSTTTNPLTASSYTLIGSPGCKITGNNICAIYAYGGGLQPSQGNFTPSGNLYNYINDALADGNYQPQLGKIFVYTRP